jgi:hypothetical protein
MMRRSLLVAFMLVVPGCGSRAIEVGDGESDATSPEESSDDSATASADTTTDESSESESTDTTTGEPSNCGNGQLDEGEQCDGADLNGLDCISLGYTGGVLACDPQTCTIDGSGCGFPGLTCGNGVKAIRASLPTTAWRARAASRARASTAARTILV